MPTKLKALDKLRGHKRGRDRQLHQEETEEAEDESIIQVPFVEVEGVKYYSDRFYLNRTVLDDNKTSPYSRVFTEYNKQCSCGARQAPPLLDLGKLIASLDLKAAILATYTLNLSWIAQTFPALCGPEGTVPTLILHGQKGLTKRLEKQEQNSRNEDDSDSDTDCVDYDMVPEESWRRKTQQENRRETVGPSVHLTQVFPRWLPQMDRPTKLPDNSCFWRKKIKGKAGVHHPKYMILFCKDGSVIVLVSTGNLTMPSSTDASWLQKFEPSTQPEPAGKRKPGIRENRSDFGLVLADYLQCQAYASREGELMPLEFLQKYMGFNSFDHLVRNYQFDKAQVHLIATVPGDYHGRTRVRHLGSDPNAREFLYGRQRVADIIARLSTTTSEWFPEMLMTKHDRLILQPTSFGANYTRRDMADIVRSYLGYDVNTEENERDLKRRQKGSWLFENHSDQSLLERLDIVWPSKKLVDTVVRCHSKSLTVSPRSVGDPDSDNQLFHSKEEQAQKYAHAPSDHSRFLFLSCRVFNTTEMSCLSQMVMYEPSVPEQRPPLIPHIKSVSRIFGGDEGKMRSDYGLDKAESYFSYFILTSACLSHGAQGRLMEGSDRKSMLEYANFELGVMFCSRLQGRKSDRLYCWKPALCRCQRSESSPSALIHLPIPYCCHGTRFQQDGQSTEFAEDPYMHEIVDRSGTGNMRVLPLGAALAATHNGPL
jgi:Tyrosyl-DNA phosphodiesterase